MIDTKVKYTGFVLAGGKSSRMGSDKGLMSLNGKRMVEHAHDVLAPLCTNVIILSNNSAYHSLPYQISSDLIKNKGPLAGIYTGLSLSDTEVNLFITCDSPKLSTAFYKHLVAHLSEKEAVIPYDNQRLYPLTAVYRKNCLNAFGQQLKQNRLKVKEAIELIDAKRLLVDHQLPFFEEELLANINTIKEFESYAN